MRLEVGSVACGHYHAGQNDYLPVFCFEGLITEFGQKITGPFFSLGVYFCIW